MNGSDGTNAVGDNDANLCLEELPKELGVLLIVTGIGGILLPGPVGTPLVLMGGLALWPKGFKGLDQAFKKRFPKLYRQGVSQMNRFIIDLDRRYPATK